MLTTTGTRQNVSGQAPQISTLSAGRPFGPQTEHPSATSPFVITHAHFPSGPIFIPPYFIPPRSHINHHENDDVGERLQDALQRDAAVATTSFPETPSVTNANAHLDPSLQGLRPLAPKQPPSMPHDPSNSANAPLSGTHLTRTSTSPSPEPNTVALNHERAATWSDSSRQAFQTMVTAPGYVNRYRLTPSKQARLISYLQHPEIEPVNDDGSKDHQTKYQAANWVLRDGRLYRKAEEKGKGGGGAGGGGLRRHLDVHEAWDVLTAEHLRSGHLGRDRLRKVIERRFIGYTLQEIMFVLRECRRCNGREKTPLPSQTTHDPSGPRTEISSEAVVSSVGLENGSLEHGTAPATAPFARKQTSNMMWF